ncbi:MAG: YkgJ family cysteine cluster protein [Candidatus Bathyarchaeia archaeon]
MSSVERQRDFFDICGRCKIDCCKDARPPISLRREEIIKQYLGTNGIEIRDPFVHGEYVFPREDNEGYCIFFDRKTRRCIIQPVKPETCVAGPITFDVNFEECRIEWYLKMEKICPLAGIIYVNKAEFDKHFETARREILQLLRDLPLNELKIILKREEPDTFKIGDEPIPWDILKFSK